MLEVEPPNYLTKIQSNLWKCYQIRKKHYILTCLTILLPVTLFAALGGARANIGELQKENVNASTYNPIFFEDDLYQHFKLDIESSVIYYAPEMDFTNELMRRVQLKLDILNHGINSFQNEEELLQTYLTTKPNICFAIIFHGLENDSIPNRLDYDVRFNDNNIRWTANTLYQPERKYNQGTGSIKYFHSGFMLVQMAIDTNFIRMQNEFNLTLAMQEFPYPPHKEPSEILVMIFDVLPVITLMSFILICPTTLKNIVEEKDSGIKELMKMMGLPTFVMWTSWFIEAMLLNIVSIIMIVLCLKIDFGANARVLELCDPFILGVFLLLYCSASTAFCFLISTIINNPNFTTIIGILTWIITYGFSSALVPGLKLLPFIFSLVACLVPNFAMNYGFQIISGYEHQDIGLHWTNIKKPSADGPNELAMLHIFAMLIFDVVLFMILAIYIDSINPGKMGAGKPYYYPISAIKNMFKKNKYKEDATTFTTSRLLEETKPELRPIIKIHDLCKIYEHPVLNKLCMDFYKGEITALLGHNGAGKTTILSILSGMIPPTSGKVTIHDHNNKTSYDVAEDLDYVRYLVGVCPQHNLLLHDLSVWNHLKFVTMMNGIKNADAKIKELLSVLQLEEAKNRTPDQLSGGMRRKLCLGMALIKNPKVLILDEPTSSLDAISRRQIWDILNRLKTLDNFKNCSIILSTHFMDEAEILGDRIAIIDHGTCMAHDTPENLKHKHNTGINLTIISDKEDVGDKTIRDAYGEIIGKIVKEKSISYRLPNNTEKLLDVVKLFDGLKKDGVIDDFMVTNTSIDDVFTSISKNNDDKDEVDLSILTKAFSHDDPDLNKVIPDSSIIPHTNSETVKTIILRESRLVSWIIFQTHLDFVFKMIWTYLFGASLCLLTAFVAIFLSSPSYINNKTINAAIPLDLNRYGHTHMYYSQSNFFDNSDLIACFQNVTPEYLGEAVLVKSVSEALINEGLENIENYNQHAVMAVEFNETSNGKIVNAMYSNAAIHGAPISWNLVANVIGKTYLGKEFSIKTQNRQLPNFVQEFLTTHIEMQISLIWIVFFYLSIPVFISVFILYPHTQRNNNLLQLLSMVGVQRHVYWSTLFSLDYSLYLLMSLLVIMSIKCLDNPIFSNFWELFTFTAILIIYGLVAIPTVYLFSLSRTVSSAITRLHMCNMCLLLMFFHLQIFEYSGNATFKDLGRHLQLVFGSIPQNAVVLFMFNFCKKAVWNYNWGILDEETKNLRCKLEPNPCCDKSKILECAAFQSYYKQLFQFTPAIIVTIIIIVVLAKSTFLKIYRKCKNTVVKNTSKCFFIIDKLTKKYKTNIGVSQLSYEIQKGNCFGLLGVNGSGKTTTFRLLTHSVDVDEGNAAISGSWLNEETEEYLSKIGYCPQVDAQHDVFTVREMLLLFGNLRGYVDVNTIVDELIRTLGLTKYADVPCGKCSGGTRRKLSVGISLIVNPEVIMLDEPTCGVDPISRRHLWNFLVSLKKIFKKTIVLTSHSLQECEVLCDSVSILDKGIVLTEKTPVSELKKQYGHIYSVEMRLNDNHDYTIEKIVNDFKELFTDENGPLQKDQSFLLKFSVNASTEFLRLLTKLEDFKRNHSEVKDYVVSMPNLEEIFMHIINSKNKNTDINISII